MSTPTLPVPATDLPDRSGWITFFGVVQTILGALALGTALLTFAGSLLVRHAATSPPTNIRFVVFGSVYYVLLATFFVVMGVGTLKVRRWARALMLVVSILWLLVGVVTVPAMAILLPGAMNAQARTTPQALPEGVVLFLSLFMVAVMAVIYVFIPLAFTLFYRSRSVKATFERRDPVTRWTDRVPLPVLTLVVMLISGAVSYIGLALLMPVVPLFGTYLSGWAGSLSCLLLVALWSYMAWSNYRLRLSGWWVTVIAITLTSLSALLTSLRSDIGEMYRRLGTGEQELQQISDMPWIHGPWLTLLTACGFTVFLGFLLFIRRYYVQPQTTNQD